MKGAWSEAESERVKSLVLTDELSASDAAKALNREFGNNRTNCSVIGRLHRMGIKVSELQPARHPRRVFDRSPKKAASKSAPKARTPKAPTRGFDSNSASKEPDQSIAALLRASETSVPAADCIGLIKFVDGKIHANEKLNERACRFIEADPLKYRDCYCGKETIAPLIQYCEAHFRRMYPTAKVETAIRHARREATASQRFEVVE